MSLSNNPRQKYLRDNGLKVPRIEYMSIKHDQAISRSIFPSPPSPLLYSVGPRHKIDVCHDSHLNWRKSISCSPPYASVMAIERRMR